MKQLLFTAISSLIIGFASQIHAEESSTNMTAIRTAAQWLNSPEASKRKAASRTFLMMGPEALVHYKTALLASQKVHLDRIVQVDKSKNILTEHDDIARQLHTERERVMPLILTDYHKEPKKVQMLREEMTSLMDLYNKTTKFAKGDTAVIENSLNSSVDALCEIARELEKLDPELDTKSLDADELRERIIKDSLEADHVVQLLASLQKTRKEIASLAEVEKLNADNKSWCTSSMKSFATVVNYERTVIGLRALRIEEKLSDAATGHSSDMASKGFFAHESPVPNKKTHCDRAARAQFDCNASGENIFMGSTDFQAAYNGWFGSDGHRFIMFSDGPNCTGIGIAGIHWTMMVGSKEGW